MAQNFSGVLVPGSFVGLIVVLVSGIGTAGAVAQEVQYNRDVRPILAEKCFACHGFDEARREAGLRLDTSEGAVALLDSGLVAVKPGSPEESESLRRILSTDPHRIMPPSESGKRLTEQQKQILQAWVQQGAHYEKHWSFQPPVKVELSKIRGSSKPGTVDHPIDQFIFARLATVDVAPSPEADRRTLIRRVRLDLTGLPPSPQEIDDFLQASLDDPERAYQDIVNRLLQSSAYGERWGRWWLDQARYADSNGYSVDAPRQIWKYRDWVVNALNRDLPFDQFTIEQLAGDLLPNATDDQRVATGFHRNTQINQEGGIDPEQFRIDSIFDRVATTGTVWLGLTIGCAQCHDHKFDPIRQSEYYQMFAFFNNQEEPNLTVYDSGINAAELNEDKKQLEAQIQQLVHAAAVAIDDWEGRLTDAEKAVLPKEVQKSLAREKTKRNAADEQILYSQGLGAADAEYQSLLRQLQEIDKQLASGVSTMVLKELAAPRRTTVFVQGDFTRPADEVTCGTPAALPPLRKAAESANRLDLARWIVSSENPLTSRVIVNRVWQQYFGRGIVETENDFGLQGSSPSHPELLDWLAVTFVERGWSLKELHRLIVTSQTYRQSSIERPDLLERDRSNILLARQTRLRLDSEIIRDVCLSASDLLNNKLGGPPVFPPVPDGVMALGQSNREWKVSEGADRYRRGLYTFIYRATPPPSLNVFDAPDGYSTCTRRVRSNTPLQALALMNDSAFVEIATSLERQIQSDGLANAFIRCTSRPPTADEIQVLERLDPLSAARVMLNLDETVTRE